MAEKERLEELKRIISYHIERYYNQDNPEISDYEYDKLMLELKQIEKEHPEWITPDSPTQKVGGSAKREAGILVKHRVPMLSLQDVFSKEEVEEFVTDIIEKLGEPEFVVEQKIDGLSMGLRYENGTLSVAVTRGDGIIQGEDVTENAKVIKDVKKTLKDKVPYIEVRGEVYMSNDAFIKVNEQQELLGKKLFANPRNCAAGTLRQLDSKITKERELSMFIFNIQETEGIEFQTHTEGYQWLKKQGIKVIDGYYICKTAKEVWDAIEAIGEQRGKLAYDIDGAVIKINKLEDRKQLGSTSKVPKWAVAYKYPPEEKETKVIAIELSVGRTGRITPTAIFEPVRLCGTNVERATLHNQDFIDELDIGVGDTVVVYKSGEIIPKVRRVVKEKRTPDVEKYQIPNICPICGAPALRENDTADIRCTGTHCPAQLERQVINFVSRDAMDVKGFGSAYVIELIKEGYIKTIADIYSLKNYRDELIEKGIIGKEKNTDKLLDIIEKTKKNEPQRLLTGLGIRNVGKAAAKEIMNYFGSIEKLETATEEELCEVNEIGEISARAIKEYFEEKENRIIIQQLKDAGVNMKVTKKEETEGIFSKKTFVITGTLPTLSRLEAAELIEQHGGKVSGSVSKKTSYVLAGENAGSKLEKATALEVDIIDEAKLYEMLEKEKEENNS